MRKLDTIQKEHLLDHVYATDNADHSGANHFYTVMDSNDSINYDVNIWHCEEYRCISIYGTGSDKGAIRKERKV